MHQSDIRGLASAGRPVPTGICSVESEAFYEREYRTNVTAHIGWDAYRSGRACTSGLFPLSFLCWDTPIQFFSLPSPEIEAMRKTPQDALAHP